MDLRRELCHRFAGRSMARWQTAGRDVAVGMGETRAQRAGLLAQLANLEASYA